MAQAAAVWPCYTQAVRFAALLILLCVPPSFAADLAVSPESVEPDLLPVTEELLTRWGVTLGGYRALDSGRKERLRRELSAGERTRLRRLELIARLRPDWASFVTPKGFLTEEGLRLIGERGLDAAGLGGALPPGLRRGDGSVLGPEDLARAPLVLDGVFDGAIAARGSGARLILDANVRNGMLNSVAVSAPERGLTLEIGRLGVDGRSPLLAPSPYVNLTKRWESAPDSRLDYRVHAQAAMVGLHARLFSDGADPRVARVIELGRELGLDENPASVMDRHMTYDDDDRAQSMLITSVLAQVSRARRLYGPFDIAGSATSLTRMIFFGPNQAFDESLGLRVRLPGPGLFAGVFQGLAQNLSLAGNHLFQEMLSSDRVQAGLHVETAPHWTAALWGEVPGLDDAHFSLSAGRRRNNDTTTSSGEASLLGSFRRVPVAARAQASHEAGPEIGFDRRKTRLQLDAAATKNSRAYIAYERDRVRYGNAKVDSDAVLAGFEMSLGGGGVRGRLTVEQLFGGEERTRSILRPYVPGAIRRLTGTIAAGVEIAERADALAASLLVGAGSPQIDAALNALSLSLSRLSDEGLAALLDRLSQPALDDAQSRLLVDALLRAVPPGSPREAELRRIIGESLSGVQEWLDRAGDPAFRAELLASLRARTAAPLELARLLADPEVWDAAAISTARAALIRALAKDRFIAVPVLGKLTIRMSAPTLIAAAGALNGRLSPLAPVKAGEVEPWLLRAAARDMGLSPEQATPEAIADWLFDMGRRRLTEEFTRLMDPVVARLSGAAYDPARTAGAVLGALPAPAADALRGLYGENLEGLLPAQGAAPAEVQTFISERLLPKVIDALQREFGDDVERAVAEMTSWLGGLLSREVNTMMIQMMLAAEHLDRLTVDGGRKASELGVEMISTSYQRLDARERSTARRRLRSAARAAGDSFIADEERLAERMTERGRRRLREAQRDPAWPAGLSVTVPDAAWPSLISRYGDGAFFELLSRLAERRRAPGAAPAAVEFDYDPKPAFDGAMISRREGGVRVVLGPPADERQAGLILRGLDGCLTK